MTTEQMMSLEKAALQRLTEDRIQSGSLGPEVEELLASSGIYWDEIGNEYFSVDAFQIETMNRLAEEYASSTDA